MTDTVGKPLPQRILPDIQSLDQAEAAYHRTIEENISYWWGAEEDIIDSYTNLINKTENDKVRSTLSDIIPDLRNHIEVLESMR